VTHEPHGQFLPPDYSKGDESTVGGYAAVHARPVALEGRDGMSYSLEILADTTGERTPTQRFGAYLLFVRWSRTGAQRAEGHVESEFLAWGATEEAATRSLGAMKLEAARQVLDALIRARDGETTRRWLDVLPDEGGG